VIVPKGEGALKPLRLRPWQTELVGSVLDPVPPPSLAIYKKHKHSPGGSTSPSVRSWPHSVAATVDPGLLPYWFTRPRQAHGQQGIPSI
jgi:hypothetical protein